MKQIVNSTIGLLVLVMLFASSASLSAGDLEPPAGDPSSTMVTIEGINDRIDTLLIDPQPPKTGQTTIWSQYATYATGDDGDLQRGKDIPSPRFTDNCNGTVTDNLTGLIWLKNANAPGGTRSWTDALADVAELNTSGTMNGNASDDTSNGGTHQTDWRLPNINELKSLLNLGYYPSISNAAGDAAWSDGDPFTNVLNNSYFSSTTLAYNTDYALNVTMSFGYVSNHSKVYSQAVWPVRGGND